MNEVKVGPHGRLEVGQFKTGRFGVFLKSGPYIEATTRSFDSEEEAQEALAQLSQDRKYYSVQIVRCMIDGEHTMRWVLKDQCSELGLYSWPFQEGVNRHGERGFAESEVKAAGDEALLLFNKQALPDTPTV